MPTHYERLGARPDDDRETIWRAYLSAIRSALSGAQPASELRALDEAWEVLRDPERRAAYDARLAAGPAGSGPPPPPDEAGRADGEVPVHEAVGAGEPAPPAAGTAPPAAAERDPEPDAEPAPRAERAPANTRGRPAPRRRKGAAGWEGARRPRRLSRVVLVWFLACVAVGLAAGLVYGLLGRAEPFAVGSCVALTEAEAVAVDCAATDAVGEVVDVAGVPEDCPGGWIERGDGRFACVELREPPAGADG